MVNSNRSLQVVEQRIVEFYEDQLVAIRANDGHIYVSLRHLCTALGIDIQAQTRRIRRQSVLERGFDQMPMMTPSRGEQQTYVLRVDLVPLFLSGISTKAVSEAVRPKLEQFQDEAARVLWEAFQEGRLTSDTPFGELLSQLDNEAVQAYKIAQAVMKLAQNQILMEARLTGRLDDYEQRLESIEAQVQTPNDTITEEQAMQISQAVKAVAHELGKMTKRNEYGGGYGELYRRYNINSYKILPKNKFEDALSWLNEWLQSLISDSPF